MNPYKVLGVRPNASLDEIESAYESLTSTYSINDFHGSPEEPLAEDKLYEIILKDLFCLRKVGFKQVLII